jgi:hypothetical protein
MKWPRPALEMSLSRVLPLAFKSFPDLAKLRLIFSVLRDLLPKLSEGTEAAPKAFSPSILIKKSCRTLCTMPKVHRYIHKGEMPSSCAIL